MMKWKASLLSVLFIGVAPGVCAQIWPSRPIRIIVATSPPGGADIVARTVAPGLTERLGQQVIVENRAGASKRVKSFIVA